MGIGIRRMVTPLVMAKISKGRLPSFRTACDARGSISTTTVPAPSTSFGDGSFPVVPGQRPGILEADDQNLFSQAVEMTSADVTRQSCAEVNVLDGTQEGKLLTLESVTGPTLVPAIVEGAYTNHLRYYEAMRDLQYPIGRFSFPDATTAEQRQTWIREIARAPQELRAAVAGLTPEQLDTPYRPGGWTGRQVAHHVPDSHVNAFVRFKLALTEDQPTIKPYDEARWAVLADAALPVAPSLDLLEALHIRWVRLLESMHELDYRRTFAHPESGIWRLDQCLAQYAWHGRHHMAHITSLCS
jgi:hypothetical protein